MKLIFNLLIYNIDVYKFHNVLIYMHKFSYIIIQKKKKGGLTGKKVSVKPLIIIIIIIIIMFWVKDKQVLDFDTDGTDRWSRGKSWLVWDKS